MISEIAIYVDGRRSESPGSLQDAYKACQRHGGLTWISLQQPHEEELNSVAGEFELHPLAVEEARKAHQRPKISRYGDLFFVVLKAARYVDESETVEFEEIDAFVGPGFVVTISRGEAPQLAAARQRLEDHPKLLRRGAMAILYAILDRVVEDYASVCEGVQEDIEQIETDVFGGDPDVTRRIYELSREVIQFERATKPLATALERLMEGDASGPNVEARRALRSVHDHLLRVTEQIDGFRELLSNILNVNLTLVGIDQNDQMKKISAWAAILVVPTIISGIYGMNFFYMPELMLPFGYPLALTMMVLISTILYRVFKRSGWL